MTTTCIIGDIHGCHRSLRQLLARVGDQADRLVFLGDYIDRGPACQQVVETLLELRRNRPDTVFLRGNHECMLMEALRGRNLDLFLAAGGRRTLASYSIDPDRGGGPADLPDAHLAFLTSLPLLHQDDNGIYVHAGIEPGRHLSLQSSDWCLWVRDRFIRACLDLDRPVIFGHTPFTAPLVLADKIGIDTGAVYGGRLTALLLPERRFIQVNGEQDAPWPGNPRSPSAYRIDG